MNDIYLDGRRVSLDELRTHAATATSVRVEDCPDLRELPPLPAATNVWVRNCPRLTALPALPAAIRVRVWNCRGLTGLSDLPAATGVWVWDCPRLTALPDLPAATRVQIENCPGLTTLPAFPAATRVEVWNCPGLATFNAGLDSRGYQFLAARVRGEYRILAGCRNLSVAEARNHWGPDGPSDRPDCRALVEKLAAEIASLE